MPKISHCPEVLYELPKTQSDSQLLRIQNSPLPKDFCITWHICMHPILPIHEDISKGSCESTYHSLTYFQVRHVLENLINSKL
jgi:hypothetical protein